MPIASPYEPVSDREIESGRILAAVAYLPGLSLIGLFGAPRNRYVVFHARQGFLLLLAEIVALLVIALFDASFGRIPAAGVVAGALLRFVLGAACLAATIYGAVKGAGGEMARIPYLGDGIERLPI